MRATPDPVDIHVGSRLRLRRTLLGITQEVLAQALDLSFQQIQKYERGINRISAGRLYQISLILNVPIVYFFENVTSGKAAETKNAPTDKTDAHGDNQTKRETLELARAYSRITDPGVRKRLLEVAKAMAVISPPA